MIIALAVSLALSGLAAGADKAVPAPGSQKAPSRVEIVARYFHHPAEDVTLLRHQGFGYAEIVKIFVIAEASGRPIGELLVLNRQGYGWGTICQQLNLKPLEIKRRVDQAKLNLHMRTRPADSGRAPSSGGRP